MNEPEFKLTNNYTLKQEIQTTAKMKHNTNSETTNTRNESESTADNKTNITELSHISKASETHATLTSHVQSNTNYNPRIYVLYW